MGGLASGAKLTAGLRHDPVQIMHLHLQRVLRVGLGFREQWHISVAVALQPTSRHRVGRTPELHLQAGRSASVHRLRSGSPACFSSVWTRLLKDFAKVLRALAHTRSQDAKDTCKQLMAASAAACFARAADILVWQM